jgi:hypothetical protein
MTTTTRKAALDPTTRTVYGVGLTSDLARSDAGRYTAHPDRLRVRDPPRRCPVGRSLRGSQRRVPPLRGVAPCAP